MKDCIRLSEIPQDRVRPLLEKGMPVYLHVNPVEYHGPHLPLDTDRMLSEAFTEIVHPRLGEAITAGAPPVLADPIPFGTNTAHGPGREETRYRKLRHMVMDRCRALADLGAKRVVVTTFHGGPLHNLALWDGVRLLERSGVQAIAPFNLVFHGMLDYRREDFDAVFAPVPDAAWRERLAANFVDDYHAGFWETSVMMHFHPEAVSPGLRSVPPCPVYRPYPLVHLLEQAMAALGLRRAASELHFVSMGLGWSHLKPNPGYTGAPHLANPESGAAMARIIADKYVDAIRGVFLERRPAPQPILKFLKTASFGGLIGN